MKKKYIIFSIVTLVLYVSLVTYFNSFKTTNTYVEDNSNNQTKITKGISMNLEQTAGAGDYKTVTQSSWPTEGYTFNTELSRCENGSTLSWDDENNKVVMSGNVSDKCYVYFDKVNIITFTINDTEYKAIEGMTWGEWVNSEYNIEKKYGLECEKINGNVIFKLNNGGYYVSETSIGILLNGTAIIIANGNYANTGMAEKINC